MSAATPADVTALVDLPRALSTQQIQDLIDREEAYLARELGAPLYGSRIQTIYRTPWQTDYNDVYLVRPTDSISAATDDGVSLNVSTDIRLLAAGTRVERVRGAWTGPILTFAYSPNDFAEIVRAEIELVRLTLTETGYAGETIGTYSYSHSSRMPNTSMQAQMASRRVIVRSLLPFPRNASVALEHTRYERVAVPIP